MKISYPVIIAALSIIFIACSDSDSSSSGDSPACTEATRLLKLLDYFLGLSCEDVPRNSLLREFIGGSLFPVG